MRSFYFVCEPRLKCQESYFESVSSRVLRRAWTSAGNVVVEGGDHFHKN